MCEDLVLGSGDGFLCGSVGSDCKLVTVQTGWYLVFYVLENHFLKRLHQNRNECHRAVVV